MEKINFQNTDLPINFTVDLNELLEKLSIKKIDKNQIQFLARILKFQ